MRVLVIGAHPDDEIIGVGGTICKHLENGDMVYVCIVTKAYEPMWSKEYMKNKLIEQEKIDSLLNITKRYNLDLLTTKLNTLPHGEFNKKITDVINEVNPDIIYTHFEYDLNMDHSLVFKATLVATKPPKKIKVICYETLSSTDYSNKPFKPNFYIDIKNYINKKINAFIIYTSEVKQYPHSRSPEGIKILAQKRGSESFLEYAEAFIIIRDYWQ